MECPSSSLLFHPLEALQLFQRQRAPVLAWLEREDNEDATSATSLLLETLVQVVSNSPDAAQAELALAEHAHGGEVHQIGLSRRWVRMAGGANRGRFVPAEEEAMRQRKEAALLTAKTDGGDMLSFEEWLWRTTTAAVDTEVNVQTGEFTLRRNQVRLLSDAVPRSPDFVEATQHVASQSARRLHCAELSTTQHRQWVRLVGTEYDVQWWSAPAVKTDGGGGLLPSPFTLWNWVSQAITSVPTWAEPQLRHARTLLPRASLSLVAYSDIHGWVRLAGQDGESHREVVLFRLGVVHVYVCEEFGRQPQRRLVYASDASLALHVPRPVQQCKLSGYTDRLQCGDPAVPVTVGESVVVKKRLGPEKQQSHVPHRFLCGMLPDALLDAYQFWQDDDSTICGYPKRAATLAHGKVGSDGGGGANSAVDASAVDTILLVELTGGRDSSSAGSAGAIVRRVPLVPGSMPARREIDASRQTLRLLCLLCVSDDTPLARIRQLFLRCEDLSHSEHSRRSSATAVPMPRSVTQHQPFVSTLPCCHLAMMPLTGTPSPAPIAALVWALDDGPSDSPEPHRVELPRLGLAFRVQPRPFRKDAPSWEDEDVLPLPTCPHTAARRREAPSSVGQSSDLPQVSISGEDVDMCTWDDESTVVEPAGLWRLYSEEHPTLFLSDHRSALVGRHLRGLPHALILQDELGSMHVLLAATLR